MKKTLLAGGILTLLTVQVSAQSVKQSWLSEHNLPATAPASEAFFYVFQQSSNTYQDLTAPDFTWSGTWDDPELAIQFPFASTYAGFDPDSLYMDYGSSFFGVTGTNADEMYISAMSVDLIDRGYDNSTALSPLRYKVDGTAPNRILKVEWNNAGIYESYYQTGTMNEYVNIQLWMYENGSIEYHFGSSNISQNTVDSLYYYGEMTSGLATYDAGAGSVDNIHVLDGPSASPTMLDTDGQLTTWPADGTVYSFIAPGVGVEEESALTVKLYPNPVRSELRVQCEAGKTYSVTLIDVTGQMVKQGELSASKSLNLADLPRGLYMAKVIDSSNGETEVHRLVVE